MTIIVKEVGRVSGLTDNHLQNYEEFIAGYEQYKRDKACLHLKAGEAVTHDK